MLTHVQVIEELIFLYAARESDLSSLGNVKLVAPWKISKTFQCSDYILAGSGIFPTWKKTGIVLMFVMKCDF